ncbi:hypothetical protein PN485_10445, partial [Nodularia spumigena CS-588/05]|nr:hypothetical protein [Nodularia spumigena CS-588/05]
EWGMGNGEWGMGSGEWGMGNGEWGVGNGEWGIWGVGREVFSPQHPAPSTPASYSLLLPTPYSLLPITP